MSNTYAWSLAPLPSVHLQDKRVPCTHCLVFLLRQLAPSVEMRDGEDGFGGHLFQVQGCEVAQNVFDDAKAIDVVIGSTMISGYVLNGMSEEAVEMFWCLLELCVKPNAVMVASMATIKLGQELHGFVLKNAYEGRCYVESALMDMYAKCGRLDLSHYIFSKMSAKDEVTWNSMISSFAQNGEPEEALDLFRQILRRE